MINISVWLFDKFKYTIFSRALRSAMRRGSFSKAKDTTMLSLAIFVDVRLRETVVIFKFFTKGCCNVG